MLYHMCCSVKRHGYPIGGMRSESPVKKQAATEEMHMEVIIWRHLWLLSTVLHPLLDAKPAARTQQ